MIPLWSIVILAWLGSWTLIAIFFWILYKLTRNVLKRRYKEEDDRGRNIKDYGTTTGEDPGIKPGTRELQDLRHELSMGVNDEQTRQNIGDSKTGSTNTTDERNLSFEEVSKKWLN